MDGFAIATGVGEAEEGDEMGGRGVVSLCGGGLWDAELGGE